MLQVTEKGNSLHNPHQLQKGRKLLIDTIQGLLKIFRENGHVDHQEVYIYQLTIKKNMRHLFKDQNIFN